MKEEFNLNLFQKRMQEWEKSDEFQKILYSIEDHGEYLEIKEDNWKNDIFDEITKKVYAMKTRFQNDPLGWLFLYLITSCLISVKACCSPFSAISVNILSNSLRV